MVPPVRGDDRAMFVPTPDWLVEEGMTELCSSQTLTVSCLRTLLIVTSPWLQDVYRVLPSWLNDHRHDYLTPPQCDPEIHFLTIRFESIPMIIWKGESWTIPCVLSISPKYLSYYVIFLNIKQSSIVYSWRGCFCSFDGRLSLSACTCVVFWLCSWGDVSWL